MSDHQASQCALSLHGVSKTFGGLRAVSSVSFDVLEGQIFGLIGPNGAGKTTIFNVITGMVVPEEGRVQALSVSIVGKKPYQIARIGIARTFQNPRIFDEMTVLENVLVAGHHGAGATLFSSLVRSKRYDDDERELHERAHSLLSVFGLDAAQKELGRSLPYGSQRRLEIARALMLKPRVLLLDEPAAGMSSFEADKLKEQIVWLRDQFKLTVLLVEHNMQVVMGICDVVHCVDHGETIAHGPPREIQRHPAVLAAYLGEDA